LIIIEIDKGFNLLYLIDSPENDASTATGFTQTKPVPGSHKKLSDDYISHALDKDPTQIFNNNEVFMTRRMARELVDEYGFKPNLFGYRRNRAVAITFHSKRKDGRKVKEECVGYLREMHQEQVRVWYPDLHISEWLPVGSRRLRVMTEEEEEAVLFDTKVNLDLQEVPSISLKASKGKTAAVEMAKPESNSNYQDKTNGSSAKKGKIIKAIDKTKALTKKKNQGKAKKAATAIMETIKRPIEASGTEAELDEGIGLRPASNIGAMEPEKKQTIAEDTATNEAYLTTGAFATRRAMRQLKDKNGFTPNPYGYTDNQAVEVLNTRSGKAKFWERGRLVAMRPGQVKVHYEGWTDEYDEWIMVGSRRIRIARENEVDDDSVVHESVSNDMTGKSNCLDKRQSKSARNELLMAENNPELTEEAKKNRKHQIVLPQDYHRLGLLVNLDEEAIKEAQKKERREKRRQQSQKPNSRDSNIEEDESEPDEEYVPETTTQTPRKYSKKQKVPKSSAPTKRKRHSSTEDNCSTHQENNCCSQSTPIDVASNSNDNQIISLRLAQAKALENYKFVANVYGYDYMQHVTVLHLDKKLYEGRLVGIYKNKVKVHYCGWLDAFDEYITLGSRRLQPIENDHEVECIEPNYRERYEQMQLEQPIMQPLENPELELRQEVPKRVRKRLTLEDTTAEEDSNREGVEHHKDTNDENDEEGMSQ
jgi:hypothetical protein